MKKTMKRAAALAICLIMVCCMLPAALGEAQLMAQVRLGARVKNIITVDNLQFKDLNDNGELDPYEDWRLPAEERAEDLLSQMDATQKAAQMVHLTMRNMKDAWNTSLRRKSPMKTKKTPSCSPAPRTQPGSPMRFRS